MPFETAAALTVQFVELLQRAQKLALNAQSTALAKAAGQEFSIVDANAGGMAVDEGRGRARCSIRWNSRPSSRPSG